MPAIDLCCRGILSLLAIKTVSTYKISIHLCRLQCPPGTLHAWHIKISLHLEFSEIYAQWLIQYTS